MSLRRRNLNNNHNLSNTKRTGERSEAAFLYQASQRRFGICKPWGDSERYDFILDNRPQQYCHPEEPSFGDEGPERAARSVAYFATQ